MIRVLVAGDHALVRGGILEKMQMPNDTALVRYAMRHRLLEDPDEL